MYVFNRHQQKVIEADAEIQKLQDRIRQLETLKRYYRFQNCHSVDGMLTKKRARDRRKKS